MKADCYKCKYRKQRIETEHSKCIHPKIAKIFASFFKEIDRVKKELNIKGNGCFVWPTNFDPICLKSCDGFMKEDEDVI